ncbi:discoidin domain-containing protein [Candidatus Zixiibacteriota bacterium]
MPIWSKSALRLYCMSLMMLLLGMGAGHAQVSEVWTETTEEDFAGGLGVDTINVDIRTSSGEIILAGANENFAFGKSAEDDDDRADNDAQNLLDDDISTYWSSQSPYAQGINITVDLEGERLIERVNILGGTINPQLFRIRGYQISVSSDKTNWTVMAQNSDNLDADIFETIEPTITRYIRLTITVVDEIHWVVFGEIQIFGAGFSSLGSYISQVRDFGSLANFGAAAWVEQLPNQDMDVVLQFRTDSLRIINDGGILEDTLSLSNVGLVPGSEVVTDESQMFLYNRGFDYDLDYESGMLWRLETSTIDTAALIMVNYDLWNGWSPEYGDAEGSLFAVAEPRRYLQYRANLSTNSTDTPHFQEISIAYSSIPVAQKTLGTVIPNEVPIMIESTVTYLFEINFGSSDLGIDTAVVSTPSPTRISRLRWNGEQLGNTDYQDFSDENQIKVGFSETLMADSSATLEIDFVTTLFFSENEYPAQIISSGTPDNPQFVEQGEATWTVTTTGIPTGPLISVEAKPNPFSPNGDGLFDETVISYFVAKIAYPQPVSIKIFNLNGDKIRTLRDQSDPAFFYQIPWDGRDDSGDLVLPGVYIYQVRVTTDSGEEAITKTITVQY